MIKLNNENVRNIIFGIEDSLVSTSGALFGLATASYSRTQIFVAGLVIVTVEAVSMGAGAFLTDEETEEISKKKVRIKGAVIDGVLMLVSYASAGLLIIGPYLMFEVNYAKYISLVISVIALFLLGYIPTRKLKSALRMVIVAGFAACVGFLVGDVTKGL